MLDDISQKKNWNIKWGSLYKKNKNNKFAKKVLKYTNLFNYKNILDVWCWVWNDSIYFAKNWLNVCALDFSDVAIEKLKNNAKLENLKINILNQDIKNMDFKNIKFDVIYSNLALHYFDDYTTWIIFGRIFNFLKYWWMFFVRCKSVYDVLYWKWDYLWNNMFVNNWKIRHFFSKNYLKECLKMFKILQIKYEKSKHLSFENVDWSNLIKSWFVYSIAKKF